MFKNFPVILLNNFMRPSAEEKTDLILEKENLSLEENEKNLIIKALKKNNNKRNLAAEELGISERTLYRKINDYDL